MVVPNASGLRKAWRIGENGACIKTAQARGLGGMPVRRSDRRFGKNVRLCSAEGRRTEQTRMKERDRYWVRPTLPFSLNPYHGVRDTREEQSQSQQTSMAPSAEEVGLFLIMSKEGASGPTTRLPWECVLSISRGLVWQGMGRGISTSAESCKT